MKAIVWWAICLAHLRQRNILNENVNRPLHLTRGGCQKGYFWKHVLEIRKQKFKNESLWLLRPHPAKRGWRERQQDLKNLASGSYFKGLKRKYMEFYIIELPVGSFFVNTVLGLLLGEGLGPESVHRIEIHTLPLTMGTEGQLLSTSVSQSISSNTSLYELKTWPRVSSWDSTLECILVCFLMWGFFLLFPVLSSVLV